MDPRRATQRTVLLCGLLLSTALLPGVWAGHAPGAPDDTHELVLLAALFVVGAVVRVHVAFRAQAHTFTFSEVALVVGLLTVDAHTLILARAVGEVVALFFKRRQPWLKRLFNASLLVLETCVALSILGLLGQGEPTSPRSWLVTAVAVTVALTLGNVAVHLVLCWHGAEPDGRAVVVACTVTALVNITLGITGVLLLSVHLAALALLSVLIAAAALGYRGYNGLRQRYASLRLLHDFSEAIGQATRVEQVVEAMLQHARTLLRADTASLTVLADPASGRADVQASSRGTEAVTAGGPEQDRARLGALARTRTGHLVRRGARGATADWWVRSLGHADGVLVPFPLQDGDVLLLGVAGRIDDVTTFDPEDQRLLETLTAHAAMALEKGRLISALRTEAVRREHQALHDPLTGLPNRLHFVEQAERLAGTGRRCAVLLMDLDGFKDVNDTLGHHTGDELLQEIGRRLGAGTGPGDVAARLGGDEFALLVDLGEADGTGTDGALADAHAAALRVLAAVEAPVHLCGVDLDVRASLGVALWPEHAEDVSALVQRADVAMYQAKASGGRLAVYEATLDHHTPWRLQLASDLRRGIEEGQLVVHYQPKMDLRTGAIVGVESLVRWEHPEHGRIRPDEFIPVAEQVGLITALTWVVLETSLRDLASWRAGGLALTVAVNVSARSLLEPGFVERVLSTVSSAGVPASQVVLELTESSIMGDPARTMDVLERLRDAGIRLSVDDFGTGYSSLAYLQRLPVSELKVDRSFVFPLSTSAQDRAIVQSVIDLGHSLGLRVVAEGVENELTADLLRSMGCDLSQGYLLSPPLPVAELTAWLSTRGTPRPTALPVPRQSADAPAVA